MSQRFRLLTEAHVASLLPMGDLVTAMEGALARFSAETRQRLDAYYPPDQANNPVDLGGRRFDEAADCYGEELALVTRLGALAPSRSTAAAGQATASPADGCRRWHIIWHVLLPEALPGIVGGFTITLVTMINSSAMAGAIGAGGLGDIAYRYGYQRFQTEVMVVTVAILVVLVQLLQFFGDRLVLRFTRK